MKKKILKILLRLLILALIVVGIIFMVKYINNKQIIGEDIDDIKIVCLDDTGRETTLKKEEILEYTPYDSMDHEESKAYLAKIIRDWEQTPLTDLEFLLTLKEY